ncbi:MAG: DUF4258 domain-containing protein [Chloroflexi bacterium]|nr:DUF4258 domain-containing protein [Chloroflexota bacterium]
MADLREIIQKVREGEYAYSRHALEEMEADGITHEMLVYALTEGRPEIVEDYPEDRRGASCLVLAWLPERYPVHIVVGYSRTRARIITVYRPDTVREWQTDYRTRRP